MLANAKANVKAMGQGSGSNKGGLKGVVGGIVAGGTPLEFHPVVFLFILWGCMMVSRSIHIPKP